MSDTFKPSAASRALFDDLPNLFGSASNEFFAFWQTESNPRHAGSIVARRYAMIATHFAYLGALVDGREPNKALWLAACSEWFDVVANYMDAAANTACEDENE